MLVSASASARAEGVAVESSGTLADRLDTLFRTVRPRNRSEYSYEEVAQSLRDAGGPTISATYIWQLRKGLRDNPTKHHLEALAGFFGVPVAYFFDDDEQHARISQELALLGALRDSKVRNLAMRGGELSDKGREVVLALIEAVHKQESESRRPQTTGEAEQDQGDPPRA